MVTKVPEPFYYKGWVIQPSPLGFVVSENLDTSMPESNAFGNIETACQYIDDEIKRSGRRNGRGTYD